MPTDGTCPGRRSPRRSRPAAQKRSAAAEPGPRERERYLASLHLEDLALACACALGDHAAWDHFVLEMRPPLYRAADALDRSGGARELADSLYADLYVSSSATGTAVAAPVLSRPQQSRHVAACRSCAASRRSRARRAAYGPACRRICSRTTASTAPRSRLRRGFVELLRTGLETAMAGLDAARSPSTRVLLRAAVDAGSNREAVERARGNDVATARADARAHPGEASKHLLRDRGSNDVQIARCFECATEDVGATNLEEILDARSG